MTQIEEATHLFQQYAEKLAASRTVERQAGEDLVAEVNERLKQLNYILNQLDQLEVLLRQVVMVETVDDKGQTAFFNLNAGRDQFHWFVTRLLSESFYYFAFRVRQILRNKVSPFPHLNNFESPGVRDVRNHLIEHPEGNASRVFSQVFSWTPGSGMHLKAGRKENEVGRHEDAGPSANAAEFISNLVIALKTALANLGQPGQ